LPRLLEQADDGPSVDSPHEPDAEICGKCSRQRDLMNEPDYLAPLAEARINGVFVPTWHVEVEQTAYSVADTASALTFLADAPLDYGSLAQRVVACPFDVFLGTRDTRATTKSQGTRLFTGLLDEIDSTYEDDTISLSARGAAALLIDQRITTRFDMNESTDRVIVDMITTTPGGLTAKVDSKLPDGSPVPPIGKLLQQDFVSTARNSRAFDVINLLADGLGWNVRVQGTTVIVGAPPSRGSVPELAKVWARDAGTKLFVQHSAIHAHDIKVVVHSYLPRTKSRSGAGSVSTAEQPTMGLPTEAPPGTPTTSGPSGRQAGFTTIGDGYAGQIYSFHVAGLTSAQCQAMANQIRDELSRHEFIATLTFAPSPDEIAMLAPLGTEFTVLLSGCSQASHNGLYHPKKVVWTWDVGDSDQGVADGLTCEITMANHEIPAPTGGL
jgi:hypothetical protein